MEPMALGEDSDVSATFLSSSFRTSAESAGKTNVVIEILLVYRLIKGCDGVY